MADPDDASLPDVVPGVRIRDARPEDAEAVAGIWRVGWHDAHAGRVPDALVAARTRESFVERARDRVADTRLAEVGGGVAGFVMRAGDEVEQVYVDAAHRGAGIAPALLADAEDTLRAAGHVSAWLAVVPGNERARAFYAKQGWADEGDFTHHAPVGDGYVEVLCRRYTKRLT